MQQAIERIKRSLQAYREGSTSKILARIELVSAFKVVSQTLRIDANVLQSLVEAFIDRVLVQLNEGKLTMEEAIAELSKVYGAAHRDDAEILTYMAEFQ